MKIRCHFSNMSQIKVFFLFNRCLLNFVLYSIISIWQGIYCRTISFYNFPCVVGTLCNVNKILTFLVFKDKIYFHNVVLESHFSCFKKTHLPIAIQSNKHNMFMFCVGFLFNNAQHIPCHIPRSLKVSSITSP
jgi:hypothetical protein